MEILISILIIIIIILVCLCINLFETSKEAKARADEYSRNCDLAEQDRDNAIAEIDILDKEISFLKQQEKEKLKEEPLVLNNEKILSSKKRNEKKIRLTFWQINGIIHKEK